MPDTHSAAYAYHHIETIRHELPEGGCQFVAHCTEHQTRALLSYPNATEAYDKFVCDPLDQYFVIASAEGEAPRITDLGGLRAAMREAIQWVPLTGEDMPQFFRWTQAEPHLEPLRHTCVQAGAYNEQGFASHRYAVNTASGHHVLEFTVSIDGNA
ncbi:hypothetical protein [Mycobacteroides abscessus]